MADGDPSVPKVPGENGSNEMFDLERFVMSMARNLSYFWPDYNAEMTQNVLQGANITDGTYILRPTGGFDREKRKFLTLSVRMAFPAEPTRVWHFPVNIDVVENGGATPTVYFSLTQTNSPTGSQITSLSALLEYHHSRPLKGGKLPDICRVRQGLEYQAHVEGTFTRPRVRDRNERMNGGVGKVLSCSSPVDVVNWSDIVAYELNVIDAYDDSSQEEALSEPSKPAPSAPNVPSRSRSIPEHSTHTLGSPELRPRAPSPAPVPSPRNYYNTLPHNASSKSLSPYATNTLPNRRPPTPAPRRQHSDTADTPPMRPRKNLSHDQGSDKGSISSDDSPEEELCRCGIPKKYTGLPCSWTVHRSSAGETKDMLYFMNHLGQTAWALPPEVDQLCSERNYLQYGKLNGSCFEQYQEDLTYASGSPLSNWSQYSIYSRGSEGRLHM